MRGNLTSKSVQSVYYSKGIENDIHVALINHIKQHFPVMYRLYEHLHGRDASPTDEEIDFASRKISLDAAKVSEFIKKLENASMKIQDAFARQVSVCSSFVQAL
jgi:hypothetical protein